MKSKRKEPADEHEPRKESGMQPSPDAEDVHAPAAEDNEELRAKIAECEEWKTKCLYAAAELDNFRKRSAKERTNLVTYGAWDVLHDLLEVVDNFGRVIEADRTETDPKVIVEGIEIVYRQLTKLLEKHGVRAIDSEGARFDPEFHEAMQQTPAPDSAPGTVVEELQKGYKYRDRLLRPARVVVAAEPGEDGDR